MDFNMIVACDLNGIIGNNNKIPWHIPDDLKHFKNLTENNIIVMGRKTFDSLPFKPLKNRINIVLSNTMKHNDDNSIIVTNKENVYKVLENIKSQYPEKKIFIIGGNEIYNLFFNECTKIYLTLVSSIFPGDTKLECFQEIIKCKLINGPELCRHKDLSYYFLDFSKE